jgi:uncharacterized protein YecT (DUF1311 family)
MNTRILVPVIVLIAVFPASSQKKKTASNPCKGTTQFELNVCAAQELKRADAELNRVYQQLLKAVEGDKEATAKIRAAEQAWIVYRDAYLEAEYPTEDRANCGSICPMEFDLLATELTRAQTAALRKLLRAHSSKAALAAR